MKTYLMAFMGATVATAMLTPLARQLAFHFNIVSTPGGRHIHARSIPRLGGLAIFFGTAAAMVAVVVVDGFTGPLAPSHIPSLWGLLLGGSVMFLTGALDDVKGVRALHKLMLQLVAACIAWAAGFRIDTIDLPFLGTFSMGIFSLPVTVLWTVGIINAINLIDGLDGLAAGVVFFAGITQFTVAYLTGASLVATVMAILAGAVLGFLFFNFNPARIFMGDSGSYFLGFVLAVCSIAGPTQKASAAVSILVPLLALGVPIIDTLLAIVRRFLERRPLFSPDRGHIHHRLLDMGITHRRAVLIIYGVSVTLCLAAFGIAFGRSWEVGAAILVPSVVLFGLIRFLGYFEYLAVISRQKQRIRSRHVEWLRGVVLQLPRRMEAATTEDELLDTLQWLAHRARLDFIELERPAGDVWEALRRYTGNDYRDTDVRDVCQARFPVGKAELQLHLRFGWRSEYGDVPPQMDILLQLVADQLDEGLVRLHSDLARQRPAEAASSHTSSPALVHREAT